MQQKLNQLDQAADLSDAEVINGSLFLKEMNRILFGAAPGSSSQAAAGASGGRRTSGSPSKRSKRRTAGDLEVVETEESIPIDPYTKKEIEFAVKNKTCGHVYDRSSFEAFQKSGRARCPMIGCSNRVVMTMSSVDIDVETNEMIDRLKKK